MNNGYHSIQLVEVGRERNGTTKSKEVEEDMRQFIKL